MLSKEEEQGHLSGIARKRYLRSASWTDRSPTKPSTSSTNPRPHPNPNRAARSFLPPLSITRRNAEEWPTAGSDDLGVWPHNPQTPRGSVNAAAESPGSEFLFKRDKLAFFDKECSRVADHVYLGSDAVAKNRGVLRENGITHVLNCVGFVCPEYFKLDLAYKTLWLRDVPSEDIVSILYDVFDYFEDVREQGGRVFVHCCQGVSRSTSLVIAYLMWREGRSYEDAFQHVRAARGVTNPNVGFACQLLQCQKRVHAAVPTSPNSMLRVYRMAPHSPYDPLHLVPKAVSDPGVKALDSRGAFVVHVPSGLFVWNGKSCGEVMSNNARAAAFQVIRYERAKGSMLNVEEGQEPPEFWEALAIGQQSPMDSTEIHGVVGERKVDEYDLDFQLFHKALAGGVVPPFWVSSGESETCLPARENGWSRLRRKFSIGLMREFIASSKLSCSGDVSSDIMVVDGYNEEENSVPLCGSPDSFECFPCGSPDRIPDILEKDTIPEFSSKSPTLSPSTSDSSFSFSPSSSNWSDLSGLSSQQPSPSGMDSINPCPIKSIPLFDVPIPNLLDDQETAPSPKELYSNHDFRIQSKGVINRSIAERRGSNPPPRMVLPSVDESPHIPRNFGRSWSFSIGDEVDGDEMMKGFYQSQYGDIREEVTPDAELAKPVLYKLPSLKKVEGPRARELDSRSSYVLLARASSLERTVPSSSLTFWLGRESWCEKGKSCDSVREMIARDILDRMDFPPDTPVQVVREGEETEQFLSQLGCLALQQDNT